MMADTMETVGKTMKQETANELMPVGRHEPGRAVVAIIAPAEGHARLIRADQAELAMATR